MYTLNTETTTYTLAEVFGAAVAQGFAVACWRLPHSDQVQLCVSLQNDHAIAQPALEDSPSGFLFCPFEANAAHPNLFLQADVYVDAASGALHIAPDAPARELEKFCAALEAKAAGKWFYNAPSGQEAKQQAKAAFVETVSAAVAAIHSGEMEKVVLSRKAREALPAGFALVPALEAMLAAYPHAFVSLVSAPGAGTWMGASPEILVSINEEKIFRTVALAGTQPAANAGSVANAIWRQKEIEEQAMVERHILNCFKSIRLREYSEAGPRTVVAGNLMHLRTDFTVDMKEVDFPALGTDMLQLLHPTSAVCGLPKAPALQFIRAYEGYSRSYYSGFLGPVNSAQGTHLFVNLRCMQLLEREAILYAGAGITGGSDPEKEWRETQHKMQTMRRILSDFK